MINMRTPHFLQLFPLVQRAIPNMKSNHPQPSSPKLPLLLLNLLAAACVLAAPAAMGQAFTGTFNLAGSGNDVTSFTYNGATITYLTVSNLTKSGITSASSDSNFRGSNWPSGATEGSSTFTGAPDTGKYIEFTLTAAEGKVINLPSLTFGVGRSATGPRQWQWRSSVDNFAAPIPVTTVNTGLTHDSGVLTNHDSNSGWIGNSIATSGPSYQNLSTITFRLYGYNAESTAGTGGLQGNLTFAGTLADAGSGDAILPAVVALAPADDSSFALINTKLLLTYDEPIKAGSGTATIRKSADHTLVETITIPGAQFNATGSLATLSLASNLAYNTGYYVELSAGAITDLADNPAPAISGSGAWNFTTRGAPQVVISQYYEGASFDKYIELKNLTGTAIDLSGWNLAVWDNANRENWKSDTNSTTRFTSLAGKMIPANGFLLIKDAGAAAPAYAASNFDLSASGQDTAVGFNGDDSVVLYNGAGFTLAEVVDAVSFSANQGLDTSFYRLNDGPGFDFAPGSSILNYTTVWGNMSLAGVASAAISDDWYLRASNEPQTLALTISPTSFLESAGAGAATATITRSGNTDEPLVVIIESSAPGVAFATTSESAPDMALFVTIPENETSAEFQITPVDNPWKSGDRTVTFTVSADLYSPESKPISVQDDPGDPVLPVVINELDSDTPSADEAEFVELYNNSSSPVSLDGVVLVFYNGGVSPFIGEASYLTLDLSGHTIPANGFFVVGNSAVAQASITFDNEALQNGADAVALYVGSASAYPNGTLASSAPGFLLDAVVYGTNDANATNLLNALTPGNIQVNESANGNSANQSIARLPNGGARFAIELYVAQAPTPGASNAIAPPGNTFADWIGGFEVGELTGFNNDFDNDGLDNALENILGSSPAVSNQGLTAVSLGAGSLKFRHTLAAEADIAEDLSYEYEWSVDLTNWNASGAQVGGTAVTFGLPEVITPGVDGAPDLVEVTATVGGSPASKVFARMRVGQVAAP